MDKVEDSSPKIRRGNTLPSTGRAVVDSMITDLADIDVAPRGLLLREVAPGVTVDEVLEATEADLRVGVAA